MTQVARTVVHLSDLHFGRDDPAVVTALIESIERIHPQVVAVSGDFTQRARRGQFRKARAFLDALPFPRIVVPGNHDVPLFDLFARFVDPLRGYRRYISDNLEPVYADEGLVIVGMDTTKPFTVKDGRVRQSAVARVCEVARSAGDVRVKILVAHHPFEPAGAAPAGGQSALEALIRGGIDVFLTGHLHVSSIAHTAYRYRIGGRSAIVVEAGTASSTRLREETNAFNVLHVERSAIVVQRHDWQQAGFLVADVQRFQKTDAGWTARE